MGRLFIRELPVDCIIGVHPDERSSRQQLLISLTLEMDFSAAAATDAVQQAIDYTALADKMIAIARQGRFQLIETLAETIADALFFPPIVWLEIEVQKPRAIAGTPQVGVQVTRTTAG